MPDKVVKCRNFLGVLYPDSDSYICEEVLVSLDSVFQEWAFILHDSDVSEDGTPKKAHYHWIGKRASPVPISTISKALGVSDNSIEFCKKWRYSCRYLIHLDSPDKALYDIADVTANFEINKFLSEMSDLDMAKKLLDFVENERPTRLIDLMRWSMVNGCWSEFRRSSGSWAIAIHEIHMEENLK